ncbi:MAG: sugar ABC transporter ATP-binding protein [Candidatus Nephthysia bennettiae]|nr:MAG: sugar ABC transporter ATP-binding protein [Candidatus Dormibacteraeota bacterium]
MASVAYNHVFKRYSAEAVAVKDLNLQILDTEFMVLVGPSGCGKSTALRMLAGLEEISDGEIKIGDRVVNEVPARERDIAMVFQSYALYPHMSVYDNMAFGLKMRRTPKSDIETKVKEASKILGLDNFLKRKPRQLSGGQRQRVALGRAIVRNPQVFLLDEPLSNLDAALRVETRINLQKLHRRLETTFIYVTHDQVEAMTMGDRIAVMKDGTLQQCASPREIYENPVNMYVAGFIGSPKMNFVRVRVEGGVAKAAGFEVPLPAAPNLEKGILGVRPEDLNEHPHEGSPTLDMKIEVVEVLGSDQYLYGTVGGDTLIARVGSYLDAEPGDRIRLGMAVSRVHLFDEQTEKSLVSTPYRHRRIRDVQGA